jgi:hypothetical protein
MNLEFDSSYQYKVDELIALNLDLHSRLIDSILSAAVEAYAVESRFNEIRSLWMEQDFKLAVHIPDSIRKIPGLYLF